MSDQKSIRVLVVGCGNMGASHAQAFKLIPGFDICGIVSTGKSKEVLNEKLGGGYALFNDYEKSIAGN
jgi:predicted dehydrogenase